tara:strand:- start:702 stop:1463 length:762 start_codon:yes stop_codon:yes gene_type:complete
MKTRSYWITDDKTFQLFSPLLESFYPVEYANPKTQLLSEDVNYTGSNWQHSPVYKSEFMESLGAFNYWIQIYNIDLMQGITLKPEGGEDHGYLCGAMLEELIRTGKIIDFDAVAKSMCPKPEDFDRVFKSFQQKRNKFVDECPEWMSFADFRVYESIALFILEEALIKRRYDVEVNDWVMGMSEFGRIWVDITDTLSDKTFTAGWNENWKDQETGDEAQISEDVKAAFDRIQRDAYPEGYWEHEEDWEVGFRG